MRPIHLPAMLLLVLSGVTPVRSENDTKPQAVQPEPSTLHCLAVRWPVKGDANKNCVIQVHYKKKGEADWKRGFDLFRCIPDPHPSNKTPTVRVAGGWMFAGSVVGLTPETEYEVKLNLKDPDGGEKEELLALTTIGEPKQPEGMRERHVVPGSGGGSGSKDDPFKGLKAAIAACEPGDLFLLADGVFKEDHLPLSKSGAAGKPIVFRGQGAGKTVIDAGGDDTTNGRLFDGNGTKHIWLEDMTIQGKQYAICAHEASNWVIRRCHFRKMQKGFTAHNGGYAKSRGHFISDNVFTGPTEWPRTKGIESFCATYMSGSGHVVCYNRMEHVGDGMHGTGHGNLSASDIHNNECNIGTDDGYETDYGETNIRVWNNLVRNVAHGITAQPSMGGPIYIFRNVIYNATYSPFKLHNHTTGALIFHNTCLRAKECFKIIPSNETVTNIVTRNNLFLGTGGTALFTTGRMTACDFDSDGYGGFKGAFAVWNGKNYKTIDAAKQGGAIYKDKGAIQVDPAKLFESGLSAPADEKKEYAREEIDVRLKKDGDAIDKGVVLPNFNDGFAGEAPDLGALEFGQEMFPVGPRVKIVTNGSSD